ncbi:hypothetical protein [Spirosoma agri]|uniref:Lipocalin-like domain-containing protein n=1 Tax=Spirosoma agri TaxID=1987381 RepID=A0A6M0IHW4_9BACT|nr:hypothetical protein [Spirosoma agri]NEU67818.1 hypothetical protein [Spirosoma agri]
MKKVSLFLFVFILGVCVKGFSQTTTPSTDFFAGKWEITVVGTPEGDAKFVTELTRKDGKLTGELKDPTGTRPATPITKIEETGDKLTIHFDTSQAGEIPIELSKVDDDHLKGSLMNMFESTALRVKK